MFIHFANILNLKKMNVMLGSELGYIILDDPLQISFKTYYFELSQQIVKLDCTIIS
jgi:hypothetical protein